MTSPEHPRERQNELARARSLRRTARIVDFLAGVFGCAALLLILHVLGIIDPGPSDRVALGVLGGFCLLAAVSLHRWHRALRREADALRARWSL